MTCIAAVLREPDRFENDAIIPVSAARAAAAAIPHSDLVITPNTGHVPTLTRPHEVTVAIDEWTKRIAHHHLNESAEIPSRDHALSQTSRCALPVLARRR